MTRNSAILIDPNPLELHLEIPASLRSLPMFSTPGANHRAHLNRAVVQAVLAWLWEDQDGRAQVLPRWETAIAQWELVDGTALQVGDRRMVVLATEAFDAEELRVPQEWVDLPDWLGDYYLLAQVYLEEGVVRIVGYTTHATLKAQGRYDEGDRTYSLASDALITDLNVLWLAQEFCPAEILHGSVNSTVATIAPAQADNLIARLGNPDLLFPRLELPFGLWASLISNGGWRQRLVDRRQGRAEQWAVGEWLRSGISQVAEQLGWGAVELQPALATARSDRDATSTMGLVRSLQIAGNPYELWVISQPQLGEGVWRFELRSQLPGGLIPAGFILRLLTEDLQAFDNNTATASQAIDRLMVDVALEAGEGIVWEVEPFPEGYDREILRF
ncbi:MAG: DUF1822 family protein [Synechococcales bacterium]|nr:DUF1822 family protein [Synechococcales bacterium]